MQRIPLTQVQMLKSFNSLLIKFDVSTQETSCQNFFSSPLYVREFFLDNSLVQEIFSYAHALAGYFFSKSPNPLSEVKWLAPYSKQCEFLTTIKMQNVAYRFLEIRIDVISRYIYTLCAVVFLFFVLTVIACVRL